MTEKPFISIIIPFYNAKPYIKRCLKNLMNQDFVKQFEVIMVDDASTDSSQDILKMNNFPNIQLYSLALNSGPSAARNLGLKKSKGEYVYFMDIDDTIEANALSTLYNAAIEEDFDIVVGDKKWIENSQNLRSKIFIYPEDQVFRKTEIMEVMRGRFYDPLPTVSLFDLTGRLIKRSIIHDNNIFFDEKLRYMEDNMFSWLTLAFAQSVKYVRKQLYARHIYSNINTALSEGLNRGFPVSHFKLFKNHIQKSLKQRGFSLEEMEKIGRRAYIYNIISALVSYSTSMISGKVDLVKAVKRRRELIEDILATPDVSDAVQDYSCSPDESPLIIDAISKKSNELLEFACTKRAKEIIQIRQKGKVQ